MDNTKKILLIALKVALIVDIWVGFITIFINIGWAFVHLILALVLISVTNMFNKQ